MHGLLTRIGVDDPVIQAGMGGGLAGHELAVAVSEAGGLGTIGIAAPNVLRDELAAARRLTAKPVAINLIVPLARRGHWAAAAAADVVVTHWERRPRRRVPGVWLDTVGTVEQARASAAAGADGVIAQGQEAGGHVRGTMPALELLERLRATLPEGFPVLVAGGIAERADVCAALDAGAAGVVAGTRFLATHESGAHPVYKQRLVGGTTTLLTELFGMGWPRAPHRVMPNEATRRWLKDDPRGPAAIRAVHAAMAPVTRLTPLAVQLAVARRASSSPIHLSPPAPTASMPAETVETHPLYAGETVARVNDVRAAEDVLAALRP